MGAARAAAGSESGWLVTGRREEVWGREWQVAGGLFSAEKERCRCSLG